MKEFKIALDLIQLKKIDTIYVKKSDVDSVKFIFEITNDGEIYDLTDTAIRLAVRLPSGLSLSQECTITDAENGICEVVLTSQAYSEDGLNVGELHITQNTVVQVTRQFEYNTLNSIL